MTDALSLLAREAGIVATYTDVTGQRRRTLRSTRRALLRAMGLPAESEAEAHQQLMRIRQARSGRLLPDWVVCIADAQPKLDLPADATWTLDIEDGSAVEGRGPQSLPALPLGLHRLETAGGSTTLIAAPPSLPPPPRCWGVVLPLYALRGADQGGIGDYDDLARAGVAMAREGAGFLGLNPVHAGFPDDPDAISPYTPSHRRRLNALHVPAETRGRPGNLIDYATEMPDRRAAQRRAFEAFRLAGGDAEFDTFRAAEGRSLERFAIHQALSGRFGAYWSDWPSALHDPDGAAIAREADGLEAECGFHAWLQWCATTALRRADAQMKAAGMPMGLYLDLAVGTHPFGAETWEDRDSFALGASLGAPPDAFSASGQDWALAPFNPRALVASGFRPLAETLRCQLRLAGALRIDHILGFDRAFWVPSGGDLAGAYVRMPREAMLAVLRLEAARAGAVIVGEDLGNVPRGFRKRMDWSGLLGCRVQMFERSGGTPPRFRAPAQYDAAAIASFSTHDLPTWHGWRRGAEIDARAELGHIDPPTAQRAHADRRTEVAAFDEMTAAAAGDTGPTDPADPDRVHIALAASASALVAVQAETLLEVDAQPNLPGTVDEYPNWRQRLPGGVTALERAPVLKRCARIMAARGR